MRERRGCESSDEQESVEVGGIGGLWGLLVGWVDASMSPRDAQDILGLDNICVVGSMRVDLYMKVENSGCANWSVQSLDLGIWGRRTGLLR